MTQKKALPKYILPEERGID